MFFNTVRVKVLSKQEVAQENAVAAGFWFGQIARAYFRNYWSHVGAYLYGGLLPPLSGLFSVFAVMQCVLIVKILLFFNVHELFIGFVIFTLFAAPIYIRVFAIFQLGMFFSILPFAVVYLSEKGLAYAPDPIWGAVLFSVPIVFVFLRLINLQNALPSSFYRFFVVLFSVTSVPASLLAVNRISPNFIYTRLVFNTLTDWIHVYLRGGLSR